MGLNDEKRNTFFITLFRVKSCENLRSIFCFTKFTKASVLTPSTKNRPKSLESHQALGVKYRDLSQELLSKHCDVFGPRRASHGRRRAVHTNTAYRICCIVYMPYRDTV